MNATGILKTYFGHDAFREGQQGVIDAVMAGGDVLCVMPTGSGKSMCYQVPALLLPGITLVISPLISLMKDQVAALLQAGVPAAYLNSSLTAGQYAKALERAREEHYKIIYVAPERLETQDFLRFARNAAVSFLAVDEAHCVSQWGQDFRPSYLKIPAFIDALPKRPVVGAFTATATREVRLDIERLLGLRAPMCAVTGFDRPNLFFDVRKPKDKLRYLTDDLQKRAGQSGIVYCATRANVERVCAALCRAGIPATRYHAGLDDAERRDNQDNFATDARRVMVATNAFGMGIDKSNVSFVIHYNMPKNIESYYQEAGRAGRDGAQADCVLLYADADVATCRFIIEHSEENTELTADERAAVYKRDMQRLSQMVAYCKTDECLRACILRYFGEDGGACGHCGNCAASFRSVDVTREARQVLACVSDVQARYRYGLGVTLIKGALLGSRDKRVLQMGLDKLPAYGALRGASKQKIGDIIDTLIAKGYLALTEGEYPVLRLAKREQGERVAMNVRHEEAPAQSRKESNSAVPQDETLYDLLRAVRLRVANRERVPAYVVFSNATLMDMANKLPLTREAFLQVSGVGETKAFRYGDEFMREILAYVRSR